jgi:cyclophilin family peptidyl-prolyl cis-trans isomerase
MSANKKSLKVFLCHAHGDSAEVRKLYTRLINDGIDAWLDKEKLVPGQDWELEIGKAVAESDVVVVCLSAKFNQEGFRQREVRLALDAALEKPEGDIFIIPARLDDTETPQSLKKWHWVDLFANDGYELLLRALIVRAKKRGLRLKPVTRRDNYLGRGSKFDESPKIQHVIKQQTTKTKVNKEFNPRIHNWKSVQANQTENIIRYVAIVAVVLVLVLLTWNTARMNALRQTDVPPLSTEPNSVISPIASPTTGKPQVIVKQYDAPPPMSIDVEKKYFATFEMEKGGTFVVELYPDKAPITVNSFVFLAREGFFDGVTFHRVLEDFMAQGGDPTGTGTGGPGYRFVNEDSDLTFDKEGMVAMANSGRDTNGSQFFITFGPAEFLNGDYTIFGQVIEGMNVVNGITRRDPNLNPGFTGDLIATITITEE